MRKIIYTTHLIEGYHRQLRKVTKGKNIMFPTDDSLVKILYMEVTRKWTMRVHNWGKSSVNLQYTSRIVWNRTSSKISLIEFTQNYWHSRVSSFSFVIHIWTKVQRFGYTQWTAYCFVETEEASSDCVTGYSGPHPSASHVDCYSRWDRPHCTSGCARSAQWRCCPWLVPCHPCWCEPRFPSADWYIADL